MYINAGEGENGGSCVCVCVCVCVWESVCVCERERERERESTHACACRLNQSTVCPPPPLPSPYPHPSPIPRSWDDDARSSPGTTITKHARTVDTPNITGPRRDAGDTACALSTETQVPVHANHTCLPNKLAWGTDSGHDLGMDHRTFVEASRDLWGRVHKRYYRTVVSETKVDNFLSL